VDLRVSATVSATARLVMKHADFLEPNTCPTSEYAEVNARALLSSSPAGICSASHLCIESAKCLPCAWLLNGQLAELTHRASASLSGELPPGYFPL